MPVELEFRSLPVSFARAKAEEGAEPSPIRATMSTEEPTPMVDWERWEIVDEVLLSKAMQHPDQVPLLDSHRRWEVSNQLGSVRNIGIEDGATAGDLEFSNADEKARSARAKVLEGHLTDVSVGYEVLEKTYIPEKTKQKIGGREFSGPKNIVTKWRLRELSVTPIGADERAKIRGYQSEADMLRAIRERQLSGGSETTPPKPKTMADAETTKQAPAVSVVSEAPSAEETLRAERKRVADINEMSDQVKARWPEAVGMAAKAVEAGTTQEVFQRSLFEIMRGEPAGTPGTNNQSQSKQEKRDISKFSFLKVIRASLPPGSEGHVPLEGLEKEMAQQATKEAKEHNVVVKGIGIPACVIGADTFHDRYLQRKMAGRMSQRDMTTTAGQGGYTIETDVPSFIDVLWENTVFNELGVTFFTGLTGDVSFPRFVRGSTPAHKAENATADEISPTTEQVLLSPRRLPAFIDLSKMLIRQSAFSIELWVRNYLAMQFAVEMENVGIEGGGSEEPTGILGTVGIGAVVAGDPDGAAITWADVINLKREVAKDNALQQRLGYLGNPDVTAALQTTDRTSNTSVFIMGDDPNRLAGYPYRDTTNVPNDLTKGAGTALSALIFGNWADLYVGQWGGVDILTNPYTKAKEGLVEVVAELYYDLEVARPVSFAAIQDIVTT